MSEELFHISDSIDSAIIMHRDVHFGGQFSAMIEYYTTDGKGVQSDFSLDRILFLSHLEEKSGQNLSSVLLSKTDLIQVARAKEAYRKLRDLYDQASFRERLIADLILSEEEFPETEIQAILEQGSSLVPSLVELLRSDQLLDPLFPGYGLAPELAALVLGKIANPVALIPLFETLCQKEFSSEETILEALYHLGDHAKSFLIKILRSTPMTEDNERAALALTYFAEDPEVAALGFTLLCNIDVNQYPSLALFLMLMCEGLGDTALRLEFEALSVDPNFATEALRLEMQLLLRSWYPKS